MRLFICCRCYCIKLHNDTRCVITETRRFTDFPGFKEAYARQVYTTGLRNM